MSGEIDSLIKRINAVHKGEPWYGRAVFAILNEVDPVKSAVKPGETGHSMLELLWHMNTWLLFTLNRIEKKEEKELSAFEMPDWRKVNPEKQTWAQALKEFRQTITKITNRLKEKNDSFLDEKVAYRKYNFRYLINGMIEHNIYHIGQIALLNKTPL